MKSFSYIKRTQQAQLKLTESSRVGKETCETQLKSPSRLLSRQKITDNHEDEHEGFSADFVRIYLQWLETDHQAEGACCYIKLLRINVQSYFKLIMGFRFTNGGDHICNQMLCILFSS